MKSGFLDAVLYDRSSGPVADFDIHHEDDQIDLRPSMGIIFGVLLSLPFWVVAVWITCVGACISGCGYYGGIRHSAGRSSRAFRSVRGFSRWPRMSDARRLKGNARLSASSAHFSSWGLLTRRRPRQTPNGDRFRSIARAQNAINLCEMGLYRADPEIEFAGDLFHRAAGGEQAQHIRLPRGQARHALPRIRYAEKLPVPVTHTVQFRDVDDRYRHTDDLIGGIAHRLI